jgi:hypothetical protein
MAGPGELPQIVEHDDLLLSGILTRVTFRREMTRALSEG